MLGLLILSTEKQEHEPKYKARIIIIIIIIIIMKSVGNREHTVFLYINVTCYAVSRLYVGD